ncbi:amino acid--tRNA ligase-related protein [Lentilitoribacter sp. EG35]|uniref:amino acid--tRNA ligase-related protein n=1 Tax=Lentilitoribacter sp. EG35 TaxID=3234192 RepID=UPI00345F9133
MDQKLESYKVKIANKRLKSPDSWKNPNEHLEILLKSPWYSSVLSVFNTCSIATHNFFQREQSSIAFAPITTGSISSPMGLGSDSLPVSATIDGRDIYLADSMQFSLELALRVTGKTAYYILPSFRGEKSDARHLNQFIHAEAELFGNLDDVIGFVERYFKYMAQVLLDISAEEVLRMGGDLAKLERVAGYSEKFPRISFEDATALLSNEPTAFERCDTGDLRITNHGERIILKGHDTPVWITHMPASTVPFYQAVSSNDTNISLTADLLAGIGETVGAGERARTQLDVLENLNRSKVDPKDYEWYLEMKRLTPVQTSGFGMGLERFLLWATNRTDIRDWAFLLRNEFGEGYP